MLINRNIFLWILYDFANSIVAVVFFLYFAQWVVIDQKVPDWQFNLSFTVAALLLFCVAPVSGILLDRGARRITGLRMTTVSTAIFYSLCGWVALFGYETLALICFIFGLFFYLWSFTFYTPFLYDIVPFERRGLVSGWGMAANYAGQVAGLIIALPFATGSIHWFAGSPRSETLLPAVIVFFICTLPMLLFFSETSDSVVENFVSDNLQLKGKKIFSFHRWRTLWKSVILETKDLLSVSGIGIFLVSYFFYNDAILTVMNNFPIVLDRVWHISDSVKTHIQLSILTASAFGSIIFGWLADRFGHKRMLMIILLGWVLIIPLLSWERSFFWFSILVIGMGAWYGAGWTVSRSVLTYLSLDRGKNLAFSYFGLAERASSFLGPLVWGGVVSGFVSFGDDRYRYAATSMVLFIVVGTFVFSRVKDDRRPKISTIC